MRTILRVGLFLVVLGGASGAFAQSLLAIRIPLSVSGNEARGTIALPGRIRAELTITFESVVGLTPSALDASVSLVNPLDPALLARLPGLGVSVPVAFPVLLRIAPSASSALSFAGVVTVSLYTHNLKLDCLVPLALHKSPDDGLFQDITEYERAGSYRAGGGGGSFSDFLIVIDLRPIDTIIVGKFDAILATLNQHADAMPAVVANTLRRRLAQARALYLLGNIVAALNNLTLFSQYVKAHSGQDIPDVWRANDPSHVNVAGELRAGADTLKFSLTRKANQ